MGCYCVSCPFVFLLPVKVWSRSASMKLHKDSSSMLSFRVHAVPCTNIFKCSFVSAILFSLPHKNIPLKKKGETLKLTASRLLVFHGKEGESKGFTDCKVQ